MVVHSNAAAVAPDGGAVTRAQVGWSGIAAVALIVVNTTIVALPWVQSWVGLRWAVVFVEAAVGTGALIALVMGGHNRRSAALALAVTVWAALSTLASGRIGLSLLGQLDLQVGGASLVLVAAFTGAWAIGALTDPRDRGRIENAALLGVTLNALIALAQVIAHDAGASLGDQSGRSAGLMGNPVFLAALLLGGTWLAASRVGGGRRWQYLAMLILCAGGIEASGSRFALVLLPVTVIGIFKASGRRAGITTALCLVVGVAAMAGLGRIGPAATVGTDRITSTAGVGARVDTWDAAARAASQRPLLGYGPGAFDRATSGRRTVRIGRELPDQIFFDAHNLVAEFAATTGVPGALLVLAFILVIFASTGWATPLSGFAILILGMHLVEPSHAVLTPVAFLAAGAAGAKGSRSSVLTGRAAAALGLVAVVGSVPLMVGQWSLRKAEVQHSPSAARLARTLLPFWVEPQDVSARDAVSGPRRHLLAAVEFERAATRKDPSWSYSWLRLGDLLLLSARDPNAAAAAYQEATTDDPVSPHGLLGAAIAAYANGDFPRGHALGVSLAAVDPTGAATPANMRALLAQVSSVDANAP